jgi:hypothetical protein
MPQYVVTFASTIKSERTPMLLKDLLPDLQLATGPVILISGVGMLLLSMTNRLGRTIDRAREIVELERACTDDDRARLEPQVDILWRRARYQRAAIGFASTAALLAAVLIIVLFVGTVMELHVEFALVGLFIGCMIAIIVSLICFMRDVNLSLHALSQELSFRRHAETSAAQSRGTARAR